MKITIDTSDLLDQADNLAMLDAETLATMRSDTVNVVALKVREQSIKDTVSSLNLSRDYVESRIERSESSKRSPSARITSQVRGTTLQQFGIKQQTKAVNWSNDRILQIADEKAFTNGVVTGPRRVLPGGKVSALWNERVGDEARGIAANSKAAGISVDVNRKGAKTIKTAFTMPLRNGNGIGVFQREILAENARPHHYRNETGAFLVGPKSDLERRFGLDAAIV